MFGLFKKKTKRELLQKKYEQLLEESYKLSHTDRKASDLKRAEAEEILNEMEKMKDDE
ncbi:MAG: Lacal_2735 family protein [Saprospiraceae bacterium]|nr:Lacal_2735 family protein [Saprospiraceae bacterium]